MRPRSLTPGLTRWGDLDLGSSCACRRACAAIAGCLAAPEERWAERIDGAGGWRQRPPEHRTCEGGGA